MNSKGVGGGGQSLVEVVLAIAVVTTAIVALAAMGVTTIRGGGASKSQAVATKLASQGMEVVRADRDNSAWADFLAHYPTDENPVPTTNFRRQVTVSEVRSGTAKVSVVVSWSEYGQSKSVNIVSYLTLWK